jgi:hypothetical protein
MLMTHKFNQCHHQIINWLYTFANTIEMINRGQSFNTSTHLALDEVTNQIVLVV